MRSIDKEERKGRRRGPERTMGAYSLSIHVREKSSEGALDSKSSELHTTLALSETRRQEQC